VVVVVGVVVEVDVVDVVGAGALEELVG